MMLFNVNFEEYGKDITEDEVMERNDRAAYAVAEHLIGWVEDSISNWDIRPKFWINPLGKAHYTVRCDDKIFRWVNYGVKPYGFFSKTTMSFQYYHGTKYASYSPKTDGGTGDQSGPWNKTKVIRNRDIRPRKISSKAKKAHAADIDRVVLDILFEGL